MKKIDNPFYNSYPIVDLHGEDKIGAIIKVKELISDSIKLKKYDIIVVHGRGEGILKKEIHNYLKTDKRVVSFKTDIFNDGMTIIKIKE